MSNRFSEEDEDDEEESSGDDDSDIFVDAEEGPAPIVTSPSLSIPAPEGDPPGQ